MILTRRRARQALIPFTEFTYPRYRAAEVHRKIAAALEAVERGEIKRLIIEAAPRHGKSELASRRFPAWYLGRHPDHTVMSTSHGAELANEIGRDVRNIVATSEYRALFPGVSLAPDSQAKDRWHVSGGGGYIAAGVGASITGRGCQVLICDDPVKGRAEAESEADRKNVWDWYRGTAYPRLEDNAAIVVIMTRWHEEDLVGQLLALEADGGGDKWVKLVLPAIDPEGNALWPEKYPRAVLDQIRSTVGEYNWASEYEQKPRPEGGSFFTESHLLVDGKPLDYPPVGGVPVSGAPKMDYVFAVIDTAVKTGKEHDGLAVIFCGASRHAQLPWPLLVLDWDYKQIEGALLEKWLPTVFTRLETLALQCRPLHGALGAWIEDKGSGTVLLQQAANHKWRAFPIDSKLTAMGKAERAINVSGYVYGGNVKFTRQAYERSITFKGITKNHLLAQILNFRAGTQETAADDCLDTWTYSIALSLGNRMGF